jgi:predicted lipoprotein with Yx(FWY)xxD motif
MKRSHVLGGALAAAVLAGGGAAFDTAFAVPAAASPVASSVNGALAGQSAVGAAALAPGTALVDGAGQTLYLFEADTAGMSTCTGACADVWPPLLALGGMPNATGAVQASLLGDTQRADGTHQVTYNGHPLYYFAGDKGAGEAKGQDLHNFGGGWYVVTPAGDKIDPDDETPAAPVQAPAPAVAPSGYGY